MTDGELAYLTPEAKARVEIDRQLADAGWQVQDASRANLAASRGVAVREFVLSRRTAGPNTCSSSTGPPPA